MSHRIGPLKNIKENDDANEYQKERWRWKTGVFSGKIPDKSPKPLILLKIKFLFMIFKMLFSLDLEIDKITVHQIIILVS